jgi:hypothetical protein
MTTFLTPRALAQQCAELAHNTLDTFIRRFLPDGEIPGFVAGHPFGPDSRSHLICLLGCLHELRFRAVGGLEITPLLVRLLADVDGEHTETFYSYRIAETLLRFGPFQGNPLLQSLADPQRREIALACDTTHIHAGPGRLHIAANNYWGVLARAEYARQRLGLLESEAILNESAQQVRGLLAANPLGFWDDAPARLGRYDLYSLDTILFTEPCAELIGRELWRHSLRQHVEAFSQLALENGALIAWGRSIGLHSLCGNLELCAVGLHHGLWPEPDRALSMAQYTLAQAGPWFHDGLTNAHQHRSLSSYRRDRRRTEMTLDCLIKIAEIAHALGSCPEPDRALPVLSLEQLFPPRDVLLPLDPRGAAVWSYRNRNVAFQLPLVYAHNADYVPWLHSPGYLENPVDTDLLCGVPRVLVNGIQYTTHGFPAVCEKFPDGLRLVYDSFRSMETHKPPRVFAGRREVVYRVEPGGAIEARETWSFPTAPEALGLQFAEADRPFRLVFESVSPHRRAAVDVSGIIEWRTYWGKLHRIHEIDFRPARNVTCLWRLEPGSPRAPDG